MKRIAEDIVRRFEALGMTPQACLVMRNRQLLFNDHENQICFGPDYVHRFQRL
jgi:hypothetical protein